MLKETIKLASVRDSSRQSDNKAALRHLGAKSRKLLYLGCQESLLGAITGWTPLTFDGLDVVQLHSYMEQKACVGSWMGFGWMDVLPLCFIGTSAEREIVTLEEFKWCFPLPTVYMHNISTSCDERKTAVFLLFTVQLFSLLCLLTCRCNQDEEVESWCHTQQRRHRGRRERNGEEDESQGRYARCKSYH